MVVTGHVLYKCGLHVQNLSGRGMVGPVGPRPWFGRRDLSGRLMKGRQGPNQRTSHKVKAIKGIQDCKVESSWMDRAVGGLGPGAKGDSRPGYIWWTRWYQPKDAAQIHISLVWCCSYPIQRDVFAADTGDDGVPS